MKSYQRKTSLSGKIIRYNQAFNIILLIVTLFFSTFKTFSQAKPVFPNTQVLIEGTDGQPGAVYLIENVEISANGTPTDVDAILRIVSFTGTPVIEDIDDTQFVQNRFEPVITYGTPGDAVRWQLEFIVANSADAGSGGLAARIPFPLDSYTLEIIDLDALEWAEVVSPSSFELAGTGQPETIITPTAGQLPNSTRFNSADVTDPGVSLDNTRSIVRINFVNASLVDFTLGRDSNEPNITRNISVSFLGEVTFGNPSTTTVNRKPTVVDNLNNIINTNQSFSTNILSGADDPDGNIDLSSVSLIDPNNVNNQGSVGTPLVIAGVGTYTVDSAGNLNFTPESNYNGDASILFRVQDTFDVNSDQGTLQISIVDVSCDAIASGNPDRDGDGISDICDLDNDNDGILDTVEQNCPTTDFIAIGGSFTQASTGTTAGSQTSGSQTSLYTFNTVNVDFDYEVTNSATWSTDGVSTVGPTGGIDGNYINVQPNNTDFPVGTSFPADASSIDVGLYTFTFSEPVFNVTFKWGGIDNNDRVQFIGELNGTEVPLNVENINLPNGNFTITGQTVNSTAGGSNAPSNTVSVTSLEPLTKITIAAGKSIPPTGGGNVTMQFYELTYCTNLDSDGDGVADYLDLDSDNDGIPDVIEVGGTDSDRDGRADGGSNADGIPNSASAGITPINSDSDSLPDYLDIDSDNDGIPDNVEAQDTFDFIAPSGIGTGITDTDSNGVDDNYQFAGNVGLDPENTDETDNPDYLDSDSDNDGIPDIEENGDAQDTLSGDDTDNDGLDDNFDDNNDNGITGSTVNDNHNPPAPGNLGDIDGDFETNGLGGNVDYRDNGDDTDNDGIPDSVDIDDDNDGILDIEEGCIAATGPLSRDLSLERSGGRGFTINGNNITFSNTAGETGFSNSITSRRFSNFGVTDDFTVSFAIQGTFTEAQRDVIIGIDAFGANVNSGLDIEYAFRFRGNTQAIQVINNGFVATTLADTAADGTQVAIRRTGALVEFLVNNVVRFTSPIAANAEEYQVDSTFEGQATASTYTISNLQVTYDAEISDDDGDGVINCLDLDSDNDGIPDIIEAQSTNNYIAPSGLDTDKDGLDDAFDNTPNGDSSGTDSIGLVPQNTDGTDNPDYLDLDSDNDGTNDIQESGSNLPQSNGRVTGTVGANGLINDLEIGNVEGGYNDPNGEFDDTQEDNFTDSDNDVSTGGDVDYRDISGPDADNDGVQDDVDLDDDNDGISDVTEGYGFFTDGVEPGGVCTGLNYSFIGTNADYINGTGTGAGSVNAEYRFSNVAAGLDAIVRIAEKSTGVTVLNIDQNLGDDDALQPELRYANGARGDLTIRLQIRFVETGTTTNANVDRVGGFIQDIDSETGINEFYRVQNIVGYSIGTPTNIIPTELANGVVQFAANNSGLAPTVPIDTSNPYRLFFQKRDINLFNFTIGAEKTVNERRDRFYSIRFDECRIDLYDNPRHVFFNAPDTDGDGVADYLDIDSDNDGITDVVESGGTDVNNDGRADGDEGTTPTTLGIPSSAGVGVNPVNTDSDALANHLDIDSDNDGIPDNIEGQSTFNYISPSGLGNTITDADGNGLDDVYQNNGVLGLNPTNTDNVDNPDYLDNDSDNDGITDITENGDANNTLSGNDTDGDGLDDNFDDVDDTGNNGSTVNDNHNPPAPANLGDTDGDFLANGTGGDVDYRDIQGAIDTDNDGIPDATDLDDDNDGITDFVENDCTSIDQAINEVVQAESTVDNANTNFAAINDGAATAGQGVAMNSVTHHMVLDLGQVYQANTLVRIDFSGTNTFGTRAVVTSETPTGVYLSAGGTNQVTNDVTVNGTSFYNYILQNATRFIQVDMTQTGFSQTAFFTEATVETECNSPDTDGDGIIDALDLDSDNDGIPDVIEAGGTDVNNDGQADGDVGTATDTNGIPSSAGTGTTPINSDTDSLPDYLDIDSDNDGIPDNIEAQPTIGYIAPSGVGSGITDANNNGLDDNYETAQGGTNIIPQNTDGTDNPDYKDTDTDNDGTPDIEENGNANNTLSGTDTDNDGLDDNFENGSNNDGYVVNDGINPPNDTNLGDADGDFNQLGGDLDYRDATNGLDSDNDGIPDSVDLDDDNDGILDFLEDICESPTARFTTTPVAFWTYENNTNDVSGNGFNQGSGTNAPSFSSTAIEGSSAASFNGTNNEIRYSVDGAFMEASATTLSFSAWILPNNLSGQRIIYEEGGTTNGFTLWLNGGVLTASARAGSTTQTNVTAARTLTLDGLWHHVAATFNNGVITVYLDGVASNITAAFSTIPTHTDNGGIGGSIGSTAAGTLGNYSGLLDAARYSNTEAWSLADINFESSRGCDSDGDGILNSLDLDSDNDGIPDLVEAGGTDVNGDGKVDNLNPDNTLINDTNNNGVDDVYDDENFGNLIPNNDSDGDGIADALDLDSDNDGIVDIIEAGGTDANGDGKIDAINPDGTLVNDTDNDGFDDAVDGDVGNDGTIENIANALVITGADIDSNGVPDSYPNADTDGDGKPNYVDIDADNDGIPDNIEAQPTQGYISPSGVGNAITDDNNNGIDDNYETSQGGTTIVPQNTDGTDNPDYLDTDTDNDGIFDIDENGDTDNTLSGTDTDGDGLDDNFDDNDDSGISGSTVNDGINPPNAANLGDEDNDANNGGDLDYRDTTFSDKDRDGINDAVDLDDDNDGVSDITESGGNNPDGDEDGDGIVNYLDTIDDGNGGDGSTTDYTDNNGDGIPDVYDNDNDGIPNHLDLDSDNDGIPDIVEAGGTDTNGDGKIDDLNGDGTLVNDTDNDGLDDLYDANNGGTTIANLDSDGDGIANALDLDSDNDGILDIIEVGGTDADGDGRVDNINANGTLTNDTDADGFDDGVDGDVGNDGTAENIANALVVTGADTNGDGVPNSYPNADTDNDGLIDSRDLDTDNDGVPDIVEAGGTDTNGDGKVDNLNGDGTLVNDTDNDGLDDLYDGNNGGNRIANLDSDGDGIPNTKDLDSDNDGITDIIESGGTDTDRDGKVDNLNGDGTLVNDADGDGFDDAVDGDVGNDGTAENSANALVVTGADTDNNGTPNSYPNANQDTDSLPNFIDIDADNDGIPDNVEAQTSTGYIAPSGVGAGIDDANENGVDDDYENGALIGIVPTNTDDTDNPDYLDSDTDNDGIPDIAENGDNDNALAGTDTDGDGLDDNFDDNDDSGISGSTVNDGLGIGDTVTDAASLEDAFNDEDEDFNPGNGDLDYRDILDNDNDGIPDNVDVDDDNDGILDTVESCTNFTSTVADSGTSINGSVINIADAFDGVNNRGAEFNALNETLLVDFGEIVPSGITIRLTYFSPANSDPKEVRFSQSDITGASSVNAQSVAINNADTANVFDFVLNQNTQYFKIEYTLVPNGRRIELDFIEALPVSSTCDPDIDKDGIPNSLDLDSDNDGIPDIVEAGGTDTNGDGKVDNLNGDGTLINDTDNDGLDDLYDANNGGTAITDADSDGDGVTNRLDLDADNDGIPDVVEAGGTDVNGDGKADNFADTDNDGFNDVIDGDVGNDGTTENTANSLIATGTDSDNDGVPNSYPNGDTDGDGIPNYLDLDSDNDGIVDIIEAGGLDSNRDGKVDDLNGDGTLINDADGDGFDDAVDGDPTNALVVGTDTNGTNTANALITTGEDIDNDGAPNTYPNGNEDNDSLPNFIDIDADNDGIPDNVEGQTTRDYVAPSGVGTAIIDNNDNGVDDNYENGTIIGLNPENTDGEDTPDYLDADSDNDGILDIIENGDTDNALSGSDSDSDGLDDNFDDNDDSGIAGSTVNDGLGNGDIVTNASSLEDAFGDSDNDFNPGDGDLDYRDDIAGNIMITQVYQFGSERWIEITNIGTSTVPANTIHVQLYQDKTGDQTGVTPDATVLVNSSIAAGQSVLFRNTTNTITNTTPAPSATAAIIVEDNALTDIAGGDDIITVSSTGDASSWVNRFDIVAEFGNNTSFVRIDETLTPNT
ncbi:hypothetical protein, partial [uncultured Polaribacter sp.]|uniref:hypothetical protein n=1 Tax=uncultured Polaribacter sp. TaxID=174711 RepID=UPI002616CD1B